MMMDIMLAKTMPYVTTTIAIIVTIVTIQIVQVIISIPMSSVKGIHWAKGPCGVH